MYAQAMCQQHTHLLVINRTKSFSITTADASTTIALASNSALTVTGKSELLPAPKNNRFIYSFCRTQSLALGHAI